MAKWAIWFCEDKSSAQSVEDEIDTGKSSAHIVMRPTWHFVPGRKTFDGCLNLLLRGDRSRSPISRQQVPRSDGKT
jgi:hypothetical protein